MRSSATLKCSLSRTVTLPAINFPPPPPRGSSPALSRSYFTLPPPAPHPRSRPHCRTPTGPNPRSRSLHRTPPVSNPPLRPLHRTPPALNPPSTPIHRAPQVPSRLSRPLHGTLAVPAPLFRPLKTILPAPIPSSRPLQISPRLSLQASPRPPEWKDLHPAHLFSHNPNTPRRLCGTPRKRRPVRKRNPNLTLYLETLRQTLPPRPRPGTHLGQVLTVRARCRSPCPCPARWATARRTSRRGAARRTTCRRCR